MRHLVLLTALALAPAALAQTPAVTLESPNPEAGGGNTFGFAVAGVPDTDGDGEGEILVGAPTEDVDGDNLAGRAYLYRADGTLLLTLDSPNSQAGGSFGSAVSGVPDVNGDGVPDLLVGAPDESFFGTTQAGRAYLFNGATGALLRGFVGQGPLLEEYARFGQAVAGISDVTGDGFGDILIGVPFVDRAKIDDGSVLLIDGVTGAVVADLTSGGESENDGRFGASVAAVPDVDGDGIQDFLIGAPGEYTNLDIGAEGRAYLYSGATRARIYSLVSPNSSFNGSFGFAVAGVPDVNGDGRGDVLIGAPRDEVDGKLAGGAYVFSGATGDTLHTLVPPAEILFPAIGGDDVLGRFGDSVAATPDGEGGVTLVVGATDGGYDGFQDPGQAYVFDGETGTFLAVVEAPNPNVGGGNRFGLSVAGVPGSMGTFVVGAPFEDLTAVASNEGRAYVFTSDTESASLAGAEGWRLLAAPVGATAGTLLDAIYTQGIPGATSSDGGPSVYRYDESVAGDRDLGFTPLATMGERAGAGRGLAVYVFEDDDPYTGGVQGGFPKTLDVTGLSLEGSSVDFPVSFTPTDAVQEDGWNLVGNPFDASLDWDVPGWVKANVDEAIYVYDPVAGAYRTWNGSAGSLGDGLVAPFQGFWVKANGADPALVAPPEARVEAAPPVAAVTPALALEVGGAVAGLAVSDGAHVSFEAGSAPGLDRRDALELAPFRASYAALYAEADGAALDVSAVPPPITTAEIPLGVALVADGAPASGTLTLRWPGLDRLPANWSIVLTDTRDGTTVNLRAQDAYTFSVDASAQRFAPSKGDVSGPPVPRPLRTGSAEARTAGARFVLRVTGGSPVADEDGPEAGVGIAALAPNPVRGRVTIAVALPTAGPARLTVVDALGREVAVLHDGPLSAGLHELPLDVRGLAPGVYVARWTAGGASDARTFTITR